MAVRDLFRAALRLRSIGTSRKSREQPSCARFEVRGAEEIRKAAFHVGGGTASGSRQAAGLIRELVELNSPALYLNIVERTSPVRVLLRPWSGRSVRFRGRNYFLDMGSEAPEGVEAFAPRPFSHVTVLYPTAPDHPVYVMSIEHQRMTEFSGAFPAYLTHVTIVVNGRSVTRAERLLHERGVQVWAA